MPRNADFIRRRRIKLIWYYTISMIDFTINNILQTGLFSFKNYQLMSVTHSLFRRSGRAVVKPDRN